MNGGSPGSLTRDSLHERLPVAPDITFLRGNGNRGHEGSRYGTTLNDDQRRALIESLKTLAKSGSVSLKATQDSVSTNRLRPAYRL